MSEARERAEKMLKELGLGCKFTFVPWSVSRSFVKDAQLKDYSLNYRVTLTKDEKGLLELDYTMGIAHCPAYAGRTLGGITVDAAAALKQECETGKVCYGQHMLRGKKILPDVVDVWWSAMQDASGVLLCSTFEEWAGELGYDSDSRKAEEIYKECLRLALVLNRALGAEAMKKLEEAYENF
jgi:hypothetical protein